MRKNIAVIDDDPAICDLIDSILENEAYNLSFYNRGLVGIDEIRKCQFDAIICDVYLPDIDGIRMISEIKDVSKDLKIITISGGGYAGFDVLKMAHLSGSDYVLSKRDSLSDLPDILDRMLN